MAILAVVPAYNEEETIVAVVRDLLASDSGVDVLVVDDGSVDETASRAAAAGARVCSLARNMGIGVAVQAGFAYAVLHGYELAIQFDGDGQHLASEIPLLLEPMASGRYDVVIGSRFLLGAGYRPPPLRRMGIALLRSLVNGLCRAGITDVTSGLRAYSARAIRFLAAHYPTQFPEPESIVWLMRHGFRITEVAVRMQPRQHGRSSIGGLGSLWYMIRVSLGVIITRVRARVDWKEH